MAPGSSAGTVGRPPSKVGVAVALVAVILLVRALRPESEPAPSTAAAPQAAVALPTTAPQVPAEEVAPPRPSVDAVVRTAAADAGRAVQALGASGARLYSENCYAALVSKPLDVTRDRCLAFDRIAARLLDEAGDQSETFWFSEQAATDRYRQSFNSDDTDIDAAIVRVNAAVAALGPMAAPTTSSSEAVSPAELEATPAAPLPEEPEVDGTGQGAEAPGGATPGEPDPTS